MKTVNFLEAVNSGKRFKAINFATNSKGWFYMSKDSMSSPSQRFLHSEKGKRFPSMGLMNAQFELEEKVITITESGLDAAYRRANSLETLKKELGL